ncbi:unnamed protein product [Acanthoscelides obtectus]|uniref:Tetraspanin n=1 Tax=Acanthoscelides obtectus TaxID=200917 RepID=A0A9P0K1F9_ACAOB|nr:unnamed protein product [Acanthoscelides obtectus]CAK1648913.1 Tetraspanin-7 [Acanthoscelides obtectus]
MVLQYQQKPPRPLCPLQLNTLATAVMEVSGIAILAIGVWMEIELYKYMEMSTEFSGTAPYVLIGTGSLIILIGSLACCCTVKGQPVLLYIYGAFLAIVFVLEVGAGISIFAYRTKLTEGFDKGLTQAMTNYQLNTPEAQNFDRMQQTLKCCGNHKASDWSDLMPPQSIPLSCCIKENCDTTERDQIYTQYTLYVIWKNHIKMQ